MKRFKEEIGIIGPKAWLIVLLVWLALTVAMIVLFTVAGKPGDPPLWARVFLTVAIPVPLAAYAALIAYVHADAKRRQMRHVLWTLLAALIPNAIGVLLYFILRDPLAGSCGGCGAVVKGNFTFCPACGAALGSVCPQCRRTVEPGWAVCAHCGTKL